MGSVNFSAAKSRVDNRRGAEGWSRWNCLTFSGASLRTRDSSSQSSSVLPSGNFQFTRYSKRWLISLERLTESTSSQLSPRT